MDAGKKFVAVMEDPKTDPEIIRMKEDTTDRYTTAPTENLSSPISIYMIEEA